MDYGATVHYFLMFAVRGGVEVPQKPNFQIPDHTSTIRLIRSAALSWSITLATLKEENDGRTRTTK
jgi:hypothetical protein